MHHSLFLATIHWKQLQFLGSPRLNLPITSAAMHDIYFSFRTFIKRPLLTGIIVVTIALGIGASTTIFGVVHGIIFEPLPFREPDRLVHIWENYPKGSRFVAGGDQTFISVRPGTFHDWKTQSKSFENISAYYRREVLLTGGDRAEAAQAHEVSQDFFETLGVHAIRGRTFSAADYKSGRRVVVLGYALWTSHLGADPNIIGRQLSIDNATYTVVGVMPRGFYPTRWDTPKLWLPLIFDPAQKQSRITWGLSTFARLKPEVSFDQAQREMDLISDRLTETYKGNYDNMCAVLTPLDGYMFGHYERLFFLLFGSVDLVLLIACVNVANLLLARGAERQQELALRTAVGASRWRLIRQLLTESLLLAALGALGGLALAYAGVRLIAWLLPPSSRIPRLDGIEIDAAVFLFTCLLTVVTGLLFGSFPALYASRSKLNQVLKDGGRGPSGGKTQKRTGDALIVAEVALSLTLLTGAGLLVQSFLSLKRIEPGFNPDRLIVYSLNIPVHHYGKYETGGTNAARAQLFASLEHEIPTIPGVKSVTVTALLPLRQLPNPWGMHIEGRPEPPPDATGVAAANIKPGLYKHGEVSIQRVSPGYFETFEIPLIAGRAFDSRDNANAPLAAIINETTARRYFAGEDPIGKTIVLNMTSYFPKMTIIGIARDSKMNTLDGEINPQVFWSIAQLPSANSWLAVRVHAESPGIDSAVQNQIRDIDSDIAITEVKTMTAIADDALWRQRLSAALFAIFATLAVVLAAAGIYAVFSYLVARRTRETGIRMALGASRRQVLVQIVGSALKLVLTGILVGIVALALTGRFLSTQLYGIQTSDPLTTVIAATFLILVSLIASCIPAWRAARTDAVVVLRD